MSYRPIPRRKLKALERITPVSRLKEVVSPDRPRISTLEEAYVTGELDTEAEIIVAFNTTNAAINDILGELEHYHLTRNV